MRRLILLLSLATLLPALRAQEPPDPVVQKLRENLRSTMLQLRDLQGQAANAQAVKLQDDAKIKDLTAKLAKITKQSAEDKAAADKTIADLTEKNVAQDTRNAQQVEALGKWKAAFNELLAKAKAVDAKRAELAQQKILLDRKVAEQRRRNWAMYDLGKEILRRYEHYGLGDAITAREPFVGLSKVKFETYIQDNGDRLADEKIKP
jgi:hypothetical protein